MIQHRFGKLFFILISLFLSLSVNAQKEINYRIGHDEICYEVDEFKIKCGDFNLTSTITSKQYNITDNGGADVINSFRKATHPGDHPFLKKLAKKLGYTEAEGNESLFSWGNLDQKTKNKILEKYSNIANTPKLKEKLSSYLNVCIDYWNHPKAIHDNRKTEPTISETSALCTAHSGILQ